MLLFDPRRLAALAALALMACDGGASAVPARDHSQPPPAQASAALPDEDPREAPVPKIDGRPMWSANRRYTAEENAARHFERNGEAFGSASVREYVATAHAFVNSPPKGALTMRRANGDRLVYDPARNIFAVGTKEGAPRTMFKPDDGMAYWERQKEREAEKRDEAA